MCDMIWFVNMLQCIPMTPFQQKQLDLMRQMESSLASGSRASTIVPLQADYATDTQMCLSVNSFVPSTIAAAIQAKLIEPLRQIDPAQYYYPNESLHITFHSVRIIHDPPTYTDQDIKTSHRLLTKFIPLEQPFPFILHGILSMPTSVSVIALIIPEYNRFIRKLRHLFVDSGIPDDKKYFSDEIVFANTTICRYTHKPSSEFLEKLKVLKDMYVGEFVAKDVSLVETNAGAFPSKTTVLGRYQFREI